MGNNKKKGSWKQAIVGLMLFHCDYAETTITLLFIKRYLRDLAKYLSLLQVSYKIK